MDGSCGNGQIQFRKHSLIIKAYQVLQKLRATKKNKLKPILTYTSYPLHDLDLCLRVVNTLNCSEAYLFL